MLRRELTEQVPRFFDELGFRIVQDEYDANSFGNSVLTLESHELRLRFIRDRGQLFGEVASPSEPDNWWNLEDVWDILGMQGLERGSELKAFAEALKASDSTSNFHFAWAVADSRRKDEFSTRFFLFPENEGRVGLRGAGADFENLVRDRTSIDASNTTALAEFGPLPPTLKGIPLTRVLRAPTDQRYILLKKYEGFISGREEDSFRARLAESDGDYPTIEAEFDLEELSESDRALAVEGTPLVWTIGYSYQGSTRKRESVIYLRRLPAWEEQELQAARAAAESLTRGIQWE
jgi:hypothetical protein